MLFTAGHAPEGSTVERTDAVLAESVPWPAVRIVWAARMRRAADHFLSIDAAEGGHRRHQMRLDAGLPVAGTGAAAHPQHRQRQNRRQRQPPERAQEDQVRQAGHDAPRQPIPRQISMAAAAGQVQKSR